VGATDFSVPGECFSSSVGCCPRQAKVAVCHGNDDRRNSRPPIHIHTFIDFQLGPPPPPPPFFQFSILQKLFADFYFVSKKIQIRQLIRCRVDLHNFCASAQPMSIILKLVHRP
jgi:hypothetical protein